MKQGDDRVAVASDGMHANYVHLCRQIAILAAHRCNLFMGHNALPDVQPTVSDH